MIEDVVAHVGSGHQAEPYVALLRGIDPADVEHQLTLAKSASYDEGWLAALAYTESGIKTRVADAVSAAERRVHADYRRAARQRRFQNIACSVIVLVMIVALAYIHQVTA